MTLTSEHVLGSGGKNVTTSGTAVPLTTTEKLVYSVRIVAKSTNGGNIYVADSTVDKTTNPQNPILALESVEFAAKESFRIDLNDIYIDADSNGEGVWFTYLA